MQNIGDSRHKHVTSVVIQIIYFSGANNLGSHNRNSSCWDCLNPHEKMRLTEWRQ